MIVSDEYGVPVVVLASSPANTYINLLKRRGFGWVVLQRKLFLGLTTPAECGTMEVTHVEQNPPRTLPPGATDLPVSDQWALLHLRMLDCLKVINEA